MNFKNLYLYFICLKYTKIVSSTSLTNSEIIPTTDIIISTETTLETDIIISTETTLETTVSTITTSETSKLEATKTTNSQSTTFPTNNLSNHDNSNNQSIEETSCCSSKIINLGFQCCSKNCKVVYTDEDGTWGYENDQWCGCDDGYKNCSGNCEIVYSDSDGNWGIEDGEWCMCSSSTSGSSGSSSLKSDCPDKIKREYGCCRRGCTVIYVDKDGSWGEENGQWCGCGGVSCSSEIKYLGYGCCSKNNCDVYYEDYAGKWGIDPVKKVWCGISNACVV